MSTLALDMERWRFHHLAMGEEFDIPIGDAFNMKLPNRIFGADIVIVVVYRPWFAPWTRTFALRFYTREQGDGHLYWLTTPPDQDPYY